VPVNARVADLVAAVHAAYPPRLAEAWDAVGLVCGDPDDVVDRVLVAVDATPATVDEALDAGAGLLLAHHPLLLRGVTALPADHPKGALVHRLIRGRAALLTAHTNADRARPGVSDALAETLGLEVSGPLRPATRPALDVLTVAVPVADTAVLLAALHAAGAGAVGDYSDAALLVPGTARFRPRPGAQPGEGRIGELHDSSQTLITVVAPRPRREHVLTALCDAHPYQQPAFDLHELAELPSAAGLGRIGTLPRPLPFAEFVRTVAERLPVTEWGIRGAGDPGRPVRTVAVCGGAGDSLLDDARAAGVDVFVTADLRHHPADEHLRGGGPALVDVSHWASEQPWCGQAAGVITEALGGTVEVLVSACRTDPWTVAAGAVTPAST
jgi:dinuclear metal center YbgI/SA1388 family protein